MNSSSLMEILSLGIQYGLPAIVDIVKTWDSDKEVTIEDIKNLKLRFKNPSEYFEKEGK